jgi:uncharacterized membrane-anchored protein YhcB (DUF1043 family)
MTGVDLSAWQEIGIVVAIVVGIIGALAAAFRHLQSQIGEVRKDSSDTRQRVDEFRVEVAKNYVTNSAIREFEERMVAAIDRLADRLDRLFERTSPRTRS